MAKVILNQEAVDLLTKPVNGDGGHQKLLTKLQSQCGNANVLTYDNDDLEKIKRYAENYGEGGFQNRFKAILKCIENS
ncbi:hypothetical protein [Campylobacter upsaliensis]|uniref:hypothetical protein n=1 Tax=Campylobacter upsaliensis TaxID=28080 RepID=UPI0022EA117E|nr:hypothetical protein [Campylobacter upsaliensis]